MEKNEDKIGFDKELSPKGTYWGSIQVLLGALHMSSPMLTSDAPEEAAE